MKCLEINKQNYSMEFGTEVMLSGELKTMYLKRETEI